MENEMIIAEAKDITTERLSQLATEIRIYSANMLVNIIEIGRRFEEAKKLCPYGEFGNWCKECTSYEQSMVENYIKIYKEYGGGQLNLGGDFVNSQSIAALGVTKLLELAKIPADEREEFVKENNITTETTVKELQRKIKELELGKENSDSRAKQLESQLFAEKERAEGDIAEKEKIISQLKSQIELLESEAPAEANSKELAEMIAAAKDDEVAKLKADAEKLEDEIKKIKEKNKKTNDEIKKLKADAETSQQLNKEKTEELSQARLEIAKLKKAAEASSDVNLAKIEVLFGSVQKDLAELAELIRQSGKSELLDKIKQVFEKVLVL